MDWGLFVWLTMVTGARRGELCALRWRHIDLKRAVITVRRAIAQDGTVIAEKDTKTHQRRHVTVDPSTVTALTEHRARWEVRCAAAEATTAPEAFVFSLDPVGSEQPQAVVGDAAVRAHAGRLGIETHLHNLRHYSATELIAAGVDVRTVAGRLGHGGGGTTTLRVYAAWVAEADQRAAQGLAGRLPAMPAEVDEVSRPWTNPRVPFERVAAELRSRIAGGELSVGTVLPTGKQLGAEFGVSTGTAQRAVALLREWSLVEVRRGARAVVVSRPDR